MEIHSPIDIEQRKKLDIRPGDTVRVWQKITERIKEKDKIKLKTRLQAFEGLVLARKHGKEAGATFTVRRVASGVGVERIFPFFSPLIEKVETVRRAKVRRAKLYHIRDKAAKEISREMRKIITLTREDTDKAVKDKEAKESALAEEKKIQAKEAREAKEMKAEAKKEEKTEKAEKIEEKK